MSIAALLLLAAPARADDPLADLADDLAVEAWALGMPMDATAGVGIALEDPDRRGSLSLDVRGVASGDAVGRATARVDLLHHWGWLDVEPGLLLAGAGDWRTPALHGGLGAGWELRLGVNVGRVHFSQRHTQGFQDTAVGRALDEEETRLGFDVSEGVRLFGQLLVLYPDLEDGGRQAAYGAGARVVF